MPSKLIEEYLAGPAELRQATAGLSREQLLKRPIPGKWSILEVVCHIVDMDQVYAVRMKRILAEDRPKLANADPDGFAAALEYQDRDLEEELALMAAIRAQMGRILAAAGPGALAREGIHSTDGPRTLEKLLATITRHVGHHVKFIADKRQAMGV